MSSLLRCVSRSPTLVGDAYNLTGIAIGGIDTTVMEKIDSKRVTEAAFEEAVTRSTRLPPRQEWSPGIE